MTSLVTSSAVTTALSRKTTKKAKNRTGIRTATAADGACREKGGNPPGDQDGGAEEDRDAEEQPFVLHREQAREDHQRERDPEERLERGAGDRSGARRRATGAGRPAGSGTGTGARTLDRPESTSFARSFIAIGTGGRSRAHIMLLPRSLRACAHRVIWSTAAAIMSRSASSSPCRDRHAVGVRLAEPSLRDLGHPSLPPPRSGTRDRRRRRGAAGLSPPGRVTVQWSRMAAVLVRLIVAAVRPRPARSP